MVCGNVSTDWSASGVFNLLTARHDWCDVGGPSGCIENRIYRIHGSRSSDTGKYCQVIKKLTLELGGKSPFLVFEDADLDSTVEGIVDAIAVQPGAGLLRRVTNAGQERVANRLWKNSGTG